MDNIKVSVIVPVYNSEQYLSECVNSIIRQTYSNFELILIDDGSTDSSPQICDKYVLQDNRIRVIHNVNSGVANARNSGIKVATGDYIAFIDADDYWDNDFLFQMISSLEKNDMAICNLKKFKDTKIAISDPEYKCNFSQWCWPLINGYSIACWKCIFNRDIVLNNNILFTEGRKTGEDQEFTLKYMLHINSVGYVSEAVYYYRLNDTSVMHQQDYRHFDAVEAMKSVEAYAYKNCSKEKADLVSKAICTLKYPQILEFSVLTVLTAGEKPKKVLSFLKNNGYDKLLTNAAFADSHFESSFLNMWKKSPYFCIWLFYIRKCVGRMLRKIKLRK